MSYDEDTEGKRDVRKALAMMTVCGVLAELYYLYTHMLTAADMKLCIVSITIPAFLYFAHHAWTFKPRQTEKAKVLEYMPRSKYKK